MISYHPEDLVNVGDLRAYNPILALALAEHAVGVYASADVYSAALLRAGFRGGTIIDRGVAQIGIAYSEEVVIVAPRGSVEAGDWVDDLLSVLRVGWSELPGGVRVGYGFYRQARVLLEPCRQYLEDIRERYPHALLYLTGHSLGGAVAALLVAALWGRRPRPYTPRLAYLFEPPRSGSAAWAEHYDLAYTGLLTPTWTVVNTSHGEQDLVTRVPMRRWGFRHVGNRALLADDHRHFGRDAWLQHRRQHPVGMLAAWRVLSRLWASASAHPGQGLLKALRSQAD